MYLVKVSNNQISVIFFFFLFIRCDLILEFQHIYRELDIKLEERGESYYQKLMDDVVVELDSKKFLILEDGRKIMFVPNQTIPMTVVKSDGGYTYATR